MSNAFYPTSKATPTLITMLGWGTGSRRETVNDYLGVLVSLEQAHNYSHSSKKGRAQFDERDYVVDEDIEARLTDAEREDGDARASTDEIDGLNSTKEEDSDEAQGMLKTHAGEYTIEGLRAEMRNGQGGGPHGTWTSYESELPRTRSMGAQRVC